MTSVDADVTMVPAGEGSTSTGASSSSSTKKAKRFEIKKWNAVSLWAWDIVVDNCAILGTTSWISVLNVKLIKLAQQLRNAQWLGLD